VYYQTTYRYVVLGLPATATPWPGELSSAGKGLRPLPFPPIEVWCVQLGQIGQASPGVVLVVLHQDIYNADWILYEPAAGSVAELNAILSRVGCEGNEE
jgi:hypothetical protein